MPSPRPRYTYRRRSPWLEPLESRTLLSGDTLADALGLTLSRGSSVDRPGLLLDGTRVDLYRFSAAADDLVVLNVSAQRVGSGLDAKLRVFDGGGTEVAANDDAAGRDPVLTFRAPSGGTFYVGVSSYDNAYDPRTLDNRDGLTAGAYTLTATLQAAGPGVIYGRHFEDLDGDGAQGRGEFGLAGTTVYLDADSDGALDPGEARVLTNDAGDYRFEGVPAEARLVRVVGLAGYRVTSPPAVTRTLLAADFSADGQSSADGFTAVPAPTSQWHLSGGRGGDAGHSPGYAFYFGAGEATSGGGAYANSASGTLTSPMLDLRDITAGTPIKLSFRHFIKSEAEYDFARVQVTSAAGIVTLAGTDTGELSASTNGFERVELRLDAYAGQQIQVAFRFTSDSIVTFEGWYIDDVMVETVFAPAYVITAGPAPTGPLDFGSRPNTGTVSGEVFLDLDGDGQRGPDEPGAAGTRVYSDLDGDGQRQPAEPTTLTDAGGRYHFADLEVGTHRIRLDLPGGVEQTAPGSSSIYSFDFDSGTTQGFTSESFLGKLDQWHLDTRFGVSGFHFGAVGTGTYANNAGGTLLSPEIDLSGVTGGVKLQFDHRLGAEAGYDFATVLIDTGVGEPEEIATSRPGGALPSVTSGFVPVELDLTPYVGQAIRVLFRFTSDSSLPRDGWTIDRVRVLRSSDDSRTVNVLPRQEVSAGDFGRRAYPDLVVAQVRVAGPVRWGDAVPVSVTVRNDGLVDAGPFTVNLVLSADGTSDDQDLESVTISGLGAGQTRTIETVVTLPGRPGEPPSGFDVPDEVFVRAVVAVDGIEEDVTDNAGAGRLAIVAPAPGTITGVVWDDRNSDGVRDADEPGRNGIRVYIDLDGDGLRGAGEPSALTGPDGGYRFDGLLPRTYRVLIEVPERFTQTSPVGQQVFTYDFGESDVEDDEGFTATGPWHLSSGHGRDPGHSVGRAYYFGAGETATGGGQYAINTSGTLTSPLLDLTAAAGQVTLTFNHRLAAEAGFDFAEVLIDSGGGTPEVVATSRAGGVLRSVTGGFEPVRVDLTRFAGRAVRVLFRFTSDIIITAEGWYVDDVMVQASTRGVTAEVTSDADAVVSAFGVAKTPNLTAVSVTAAPRALFWGDEATLTYAVRNDGDRPLAGFDVGLYVSADAAVTARDLGLTTLRLEALAPGETRTGTVTVRLPGSPGNPPPGFGEPDDVTLGLLADPNNRQPELNETDNAVGTPVTILRPAPVTLSGVVYDDRDGDGHRGPNEPGRQGEMVFLDLKRDGVPDVTDPFTFTDADGRWQFDGLPPGEYRVAAVRPKGVVQTAPGTPLFLADFNTEDGARNDDGFTFQRTIVGASQWHVSDGRGAEAGHSGDFSLYFGAGETGTQPGTYDPFADAEQLTEVIDLTGQAGPLSLEFNSFLRLGAGSRARVEVESGGLVTELADSLAGTIPADSSEFAPVRLDLSAFAGRLVQVIFRFTSGLAIEEGWYVDDVTIRRGGAGEYKDVALAQGANRSDLAFGFRAAPNLVGQKLTVDRPEAAFGESVTVHYEVANPSPTAAGPFTLALYLSSFQTINPDDHTHDVLLKRVEVPGVAAKGVASGEVTLTLPASFPAGGTVTPFQTLWIGAVVDAGRAVVEGSEDDNRNRGDGLDRAPLQLVYPLAGVRGVVFRDADGDGSRGPAEGGLAGATVYLDVNHNGLPDDGFTTVTGADGTYTFDRAPAGPVVVRVNPIPDYQPTSSGSAVPVVYLSATFDNGDDGFKSAPLPDRADEWHRSLGRGVSSFYFGVNETELGGGMYAVNDAGTLISPPIDLTEASGAVSLQFDHFLRAETGYDFAEVFVVSGGVRTLLLSSRTGELNSHMSAFGRAEANLSAFVGQVVGLEFTFTSDEIFPDEGWYIDAVRVVQSALSSEQLVVAVPGGVTEAEPFGERPLADLTVTASVTPGSATWGQRVSVSYAFRNEGTTDSGSFRADLVLTGSSGRSVVLDTLAVGSLAAGAVQAGTYEVTLPGQPDEPPEGFDAVETVTLAWTLDPAEAVQEGDEDNNIAATTLSVVRPPVSLSGLVFRDDNANGTRETGEPGLAGVRVYADLNRNGLFDPGEPAVTTEATGEYALTGLPPDAYQVRADERPGYGLTSPRPGFVALDARFNRRYGPLDTAGFTTTGPTNQWHLTASRGAGGSEGDDGAYYFGSAFSYDNGATGELLSPAIDLTGAGGVVALKFLSFTSVGEGERLELIVRTASEDVVIADNASVGGLSATIGGVEHNEFDLTAYAGQVIRLVWRFTADAAGTGEGWFIDDVVVSALGEASDETLGPGQEQSGILFGQRPLPDLETAGFAIGPDEVAWGDTLALAFEARNSGIGASGPFTARLLVSIDNHFDSQDADLTRQLLGQIPMWTFAGLAAGGRQGVESALRLPNAVPPGLVGGRLFFGIQIDPDGAVRESNERNNAGFGRLKDWASLDVLTAVREGSAHDGRSTAEPLTSGTSVQGFVRTGETDWYVIHLDTESGLRLTLAGDARVALRDQAGHLLVQSAGGTIAQHLPTGDWYVTVEGGQGAYELTTRLETAALPFAPISLDNRPATALAAGDLDGDGQLDLVALSTYDASLTILLGRSDGTFVSAYDAVTGPAPVGLVLADFDGDGKLDAAVAESRSVSVLLGVGNGALTNGGDALTTSIGADPVRLAAGDFNGDGKSDVAVSTTAGAVRLLLGQEDGTFILGPVVLQRSGSPELATADLDGDGNLDLVVASGGQPVTLLYGLGDGTFKAPLDIGQSPGTPRAVRVADVTGDKKLDLIVAGDRQGANVAVWVNRGPGAFTAAGMSALRGLPSGLVVGDFDGDGHADLATAGENANEVSIGLGDGSGRFVPSPYTFAVGAGPVALVVGDFDGDRRLDLATANNGGASVSVLLGVTAGEFAATGSRLTVGGGPVAVVAGNFGNDKAPDLATVNSKTGTLTVLLRTGPGTFATQPDLFLGLAPVAAATADFNNDQKADVAVLLQGEERVLLLNGIGDGKFQRSEARLPVGFYPTDLAQADLDGDGDADLVVANSVSRSLTVFLNKGDGTFQKPITVGLRRAPRWISVGKLNEGDDRPDIVVYDQVFGDISVLLGQGNGRFIDLGVRLKMPAGMKAIDLGDMNGDGRPDLLALHGQAVTVFLGTRSGVFRDTGLVQPVGTAPSALAVGHFDAGDTLDVAVTDGLYFGQVSLLIGVGDGTFTAASTVQVPTEPTAVVSTDFNADGRDDLGLAHAFSSEASALESTSGGGFGNPALFSDRLYLSPVVADFTGDGVADVAVANAFGDVLLRAGRADRRGVYDAPTVAGVSGRALALLRGSGPVRLAVLDKVDPRVYVMTFDRDGLATVTRTIKLPDGGLYTRIAADDVDGDRIPDLVVTDTRKNVLYVLRGQQGFAVGDPIPAGTAPNDIALADLDGDRRLDILVTSEVSGDVSVLRNLGRGQFELQRRFRAGFPAQWDPKLGIHVT